MVVPERLGIGILGCGRISGLTARGYDGQAGARIVALCDPIEERARRLADEIGGAAVTTDIESFLDTPGLEAVEILTPHHLHADHAIAALAAGKHVSLQKPPARNMEEFERIAAAVSAADTSFRVFENFMHYPAHARACELVRSGAIGEPLSVRLKTAAGRPEDGWEIGADALAWRMNEETCGGGPTTFDHGYHCYNLARCFMGAEIETVHAFISWYGQDRSSRYDGNSVVSWRYEGQPERFGSWEVVASVGMQVEGEYYAEDDRAEIHGRDGYISISGCTGRSGEDPPLRLYREGCTEVIDDLERDWASSFKCGAVDFVDAIREGRQPAQGIEDARRTLAVALAVGRSADQRAEVAVSEFLGRPG